MQNEPQTITITNLGGPLTHKRTGNIDSGLAKHDTSWGYDPYSKPGNLTWMEQPTSIFTITPANSSVATFFNIKARHEGGNPYAYAIGGNSKLYRSLVANSATLNPDADAVSTIGSISGVFTYHSGMVFYGSTEKIFIGTHDRIERINFDGTASSVVGGPGQVNNNVPRPVAVFQGKIYFGNFNNIGEIDSTETVTTTAKLDPALPSGVYISDLDVTPDGNYLQITASRTIPPVMSGMAGGSGSTIPQPTTTVDSYKFYWNGVDAGITSFEQFNGTNFLASEVFGEFNYTLGRDISGGYILNNRTKTSLPRIKEINPAATYSVGNTLGLAVPEYDEATSEYTTAVFHYGEWDEETPFGLYRLLRQDPSTQNDVDFVVAAEPVTGAGNSPLVSGYLNNISSTGKIYFSTTEVSGSSVATQTHKVWRFPIIPTGTGSIVAGVYETQTQLFSKKSKISEVRLYTEPLIGGNDFVVDLIGSGGSVMAGGRQRFQVATGSVATGTDMVQFNPAMAPTYAIGVRVTNSSVTGVANWTGNKIEIDYTEGGR